MPSCPLPTPLVRPLDSNDDLVTCIATVTGESRSIVTQRLLDEERCLGINDLRDFARSGLKPHVWSDAWPAYFNQTKAFCYVSAVWNRAPLKLQFRKWIGNFLRQRGAKRLKVLGFGDGAGFDSAYLASLGHDVTYFDVGAESVSFARQVFELNELSVRIVQDLAELDGQFFDLVFSLDVLEHVVSPPDVATLFSRWIRPGGLWIQHSPFFLIHRYYPTHLRSNQKYSGSFKLFTDAGFQPISGRIFWDPIVLERSEQPTLRACPWSLRIGGHFLRIGGIFNGLHCAIARLLSRRDSKWAAELERTLSTT